MFNKIKSITALAATSGVLLLASCTKGTFDINNVNPNVPSSVDPKFILSASLKSTGDIAWGGGYNEYQNLWMGYWTLSGDYIPTATTLTYNITTDYQSANWDNGFTTLENFRTVEKSGAAYANGANYVAIAKIMECYIFQRLVDQYNNIPYSAALNGGVNNFPVYDDAKTVYNSLFNQLDSAIAVIKGAPVTADNPTTYDIMYGGNMANWLLFAKTLKLKMVMRLTQAGGAQAKISGYTPADFIQADATLNPGYTNATSAQQNPLWGNIGTNPTGAQYTNAQYYRANTYAVNFYKNNNDPRISYFYSLNTNNTVQGRAFGSTNSGSEHNTTVSAIGGNTSYNTTSTTGLLKSPTMGAMILPASESWFLMAEAAFRGYITGSYQTYYQNGVNESFKTLNVGGSSSAATTAAAAYTSQAGNVNVNIVTSASPLTTIITQKWASMNTYDALESWSDWRRLNIPSDLPVSIYPGTTATHVPYRLRYPTSEYSYNTANTPTGADNPITNKIFWQP